MPKSDLPSTTRTLKSAHWVAEFRRRIESGELETGDRLPSVAEMQRVHGISRPVADRLLDQLESEDLIERRPGSGVFVAQRNRRLVPAAARHALGMRLPGAEQSQPYYEQLMRGALRTARDEGFELLIYDEKAVPTWDRMCGTLLCSNIILRLPASMPSVSLLNSLPGRANIVTDDFEAMEAVVEHLLQLGHRRIAYLTSAVAPIVRPDNFCLTIPTAQRRLAGYKSALKKAGIRPRTEWVRALNLESERNFARAPHSVIPAEDKGRAAMEKWLREGWKELGCTALAVQNDGVAIGAIEVLQKAGIRVPGDVSIVGFDGQGNENYFRPRLTTVEVPLEEIGAAGARNLIEEIRRPTPVAAGAFPETVDIVIPSSLRIGESTAPPPVKRPAKKEN